jgi:hypothetical protein
MKWRFALALLVLAAFVSSTKAQTANCTTVQIMVTSNDITLSLLGVVIKQVRAYEVTCLTTGSTILGAQRGIVYSVQDMTFTGTGTNFFTRSCPQSSQSSSCYPFAFSPCSSGLS